MSETMNHQAFLEALQALEASPSLWRDHLPPEAIAHAEACRDCLQLAESLALFAEHGDEALGEEPPAGYWDSFGTKLDARLEAERGSHEKHPARPWVLWFGLAAALALAVVLPRLGPPEAGGQESSLRDPRRGGVLTSAPAAPAEPPSWQDPEELLMASFGGQGILWSFDDELFPSDSLAEAPEFLDLEAGHDVESYELTLSGAFDALDDEDAMDLMRQLREEMAS